LAKKEEHDVRKWVKIVTNISQGANAKLETACLISVMTNQWPVSSFSSCSW
jgi:hypothetical protein